MKGIGQNRKEEERELVEHRLGGGYRGMRVLRGTRQGKEELEGGPGHVVWTKRGEKNPVNEVRRSTGRLAQCYE